MKYYVVNLIQELPVKVAPFFASMIRFEKKNAIYLGFRAIFTIFASSFLFILK